MSASDTTKVLPVLPALPALGPVVIADGTCAYLPDERGSRTAFAMPGGLRPAQYQRAMDLGMRRSGRAVYRPLCDGCRKCLPLRVDVAAFRPSRSQKRVAKRCDGLFTIEVGPPQVEGERLLLYRRYQAFQHGDDGQDADEESYRRFLVDTVTRTVEVSWRDGEGMLVAVGILDVTDVAVSSVYFYWDPDLADLSLGTYSAMVELDLCQRWGKAYYYLGYVVPGSRAMAYKAQFHGSQVWDGELWRAMPERGLSGDAVQAALQACEAGSLAADTATFDEEASVRLPPAIELELALADTEDHEGELGD